MELEGRIAPPASSPFIVLHAGGFPSLLREVGQTPHFGFSVAAAQASLGSELQAEHTICYMKTLKVDHGADRSCLSRVPGAAFLCGFLFGWGLVWALQTVMSPKKKSSRVLCACWVD